MSTDGSELNATRPPFARTVCACEACRANCRAVPGHLIPSDVARVGALLFAAGRVTSPGDVGAWLRASPGATVGTRRPGGGLRLWRVGTVVPARRADGVCVFLDPHGLCAIHAASPFGCAYFDVHEPEALASAKSAWGLSAILADPAYRTYRSTLAPNTVFATGELAF